MGLVILASAANVQIRLSEHNAGRCRYTSGRRPWELIFHEQFNSRAEAVRRENFLKTGQGRKELDRILKL
ncbi:MAG: GIY-YIG nuclease family protein [Candidatus Omnitrophica bacterium]|nr:GIY-YIG nuclease family protein [Candidatus Omnitrophota bacterium]